MLVCCLYVGRYEILCYVCVCVYYVSYDLLFVDFIQKFKVKKYNVVFNIMYSRARDFLETG